jgi:hypothetical protein
VLQNAQEEFEHLWRSREDPKLVLPSLGWSWRHRVSGDLEQRSGDLCCTKQQHLKGTLYTRRIYLPGENVTHTHTHTHTRTHRATCTFTITLPLEKLLFSPSFFRYHIPDLASHLDSVGGEVA